MVAPALAACASGDTRLAERGRTELIGLPRDRLLACAGQPVDSGSEGDAELLVFYAESQRWVAIDRPVSGSPLRPAENGYAYRRNCEATFLLRQGRVAEVRLLGRGGGGRADIGACAPIVDRCLKR